MEVRINGGDVVKPKFEIKESNISISRNEWYQVKKTVSGYKVANLLDSNTSFDVTDEFLQAQFEPIELGVDQIGDEKLGFVDMIYNQVVEYFDKNGIDNGNAIDNVRGFVTVLDHFVEDGVLFDKITAKYGKELADKIFVERPSSETLSEKNRDIETPVSASKQAADNSQVKIEKLNNNKLLVTLSNKVIFEKGLDRYIIGRASHDKGQYRIVDHAPFEREAAFHVKAKYPSCWISQFTQMFVNDDMSITIGANVSNIEEGDSLARTDFKDVFAKQNGVKKKAIKDLLNDEQISKLTDVQAKNITIELEGSEQLLKKMLAYMEEQKKKLLQARVDKLIDEGDSKDFNSKIVISDRMIQSTLAIMNEVKNEAHSVEVKLEKSTTPKQQPSQTSQPIDNKDKSFLQAAMKNALELNQMALKMLSDTENVGQALDTTIAKANDAKKGSKKASLKVKHADFGEFIGKVFEQMKNLWSSFSGKLNMWVQSIVNGKDSIESKAKEIKSNLSQVA